MPSPVSRRHFLGGALALGAAPLLDSPPAQAATSAPWGRRIWGYIESAPGVQLRYSVLLPSAQGRFPVLIQYSGYDSGAIGGSAYLNGDTWLSEDVDYALLDAGYAVMGLSMRGTGCSSGLFDLFGDTWGTDGAAAVNWAARQPWSTGKVGMYDWSWGGLSQLFVASQRPAGLTCIAPGMVVTDPLRDIGAPGGVANVEFPALWWATILDSWTYVAQDARSDGDEFGLANLARNIAVGQFDSPPTSSVHPFEDGYWAQRNLRAATARIDVPVFSIEDWQDEEVGPRGGYYQELLNPDTTWYIGTNGQHDMYVNHRFRRQLIAFYDHFLKGAHNGFGATPRVQLWLETAGPGAPEASDAELELAQPAWIITRERLPINVLTARLYLGADGTMSHLGAVTGHASYAAAPGPIVNNDVASATTGGSGGTGGELTWNTGVLIPGGYLAFTTPAFDTAVTLSGSASLDLWFSSLSPETQLQATLTEVRPDGYELYIQRGWLDVMQRALDETLTTTLRPVHLQTLGAVSLLIPDEVVSARIEINKFTHAFRPGSALRLIIDAPSGTGDWNFGGISPSINTVWCGEGHASSLAVGLLTNEPPPTPLPAPNSLIGQPVRRDPLAIPAGLPVDWEQASATAAIRA